jgi:hypothetical protein
VSAPAVCGSGSRPPARKNIPRTSQPIYLKQAEAAIAATSNGRYEDAGGLLVKAASVMRRMDAARSS